MTRAFICPGQGSQFIGMGQDLNDTFPIAKHVFQEVDDALSQPLSKMMFTGEADDLNLTENTQPALMALSVAVMRILEKECGIDLTDGKTLCVAGHSLGEYSALTIAGALELSDTARLLKIRGQAMQKAVPVGIGAMAAILGLELEDVKAISAEASDKEICATANDNSNGQVVVSGHKAAVEKAIGLANDRGAKRAILLPVSAPFHCPLMQPAADVMRDALAEVTITSPKPALIANVTAKAVRDVDEIRNNLVEQVCGMVRWRESVLEMKTLGVTELFEIGAGKVLTGLTRRIDRDLSGLAIGTPQGIDAFSER